MLEQKIKDINGVEIQSPDFQKWKEIFTTVIQHAIFEEIHVDETIKLYMSKYKLVDVNATCEHPWSFVIGDGEMQPAKCLKCGKCLSS